MRLSPRGLERVRKAVQMVEGGMIDTGPPGAQSFHHSAQIKLAKADGVVSPGGSGTFSWVRSTAAGTTEIDTSYNATAYDWLQSGFSAGEKAILVRPIPSPRWYAFKSAGSSSGVDEKVKVSADETAAQYLGEQFYRVNTTTQYAVSQDFDVEFDVDNSGAEEKMRAFIDASDIKNYTTDIFQVLTHDTSNEPHWGTVQPSTTIYHSGDDLTIDVSFSSGDIRSFIDASNLAGHSTTAERYLGKEGGAWKWLTPTGSDIYVTISNDDTSPGRLDAKIDNIQASTAAYENGEDLLVEWVIDDPGAKEQLIGYINMSTITSHTTSGTVYLGLYNGQPQWLSATAGTDELIKVSSDDTTADYLEYKFEHVNFPTTYNISQDLEINFETQNPGSTETLRAFVNMSEVSRWSVTNGQFLGHTSGQTELATPTPFDTYVSSEDLGIDFQWSSGVFRAFIDADAITSHTTTAKVALGLQGGSWEFVSLTTAGADELVKVSADDTAADYLANQLERVDSTAYDASQDILIDFETQNPGGDESLQGFLNASNITSHTTAGRFALGIYNGVMQFLAFSTAGADELVKVSADETAAQYLEDQFTNVNAASTYDSSQDLVVNFDVLNDGADESMRAFVNFSEIYRYDGTDEQFLGQTSGVTQMVNPTPFDIYELSIDLPMDFQWSSGVFRSFIDARAITSHTTSAKVALGIQGGSWEFMSLSTAGADELVKISADETAAQYLQDQFRYVNSLTTYTSGLDLEVVFDILSTGGDEQILPFVNLSDVNRYSGSQSRFLGVTAGQSEFVLPSPQGTYEASVDLEMDFQWSSGILRNYLDAREVTSHTTGGKYALGINDGTWEFMSLSTAGADELVKVSADETAAQYLEDQFQNVQGTTYQGSQDLLIQFEVLSTGADESMRAFVNMSDVAQWNAGTNQLLGHSAGTLEWFRPYPFDAAPHATEDLEMDWYYSGTLLKTYLDASEITDHTTLGDMALITRDGDWKFHPLQPAVAQFYEAFPTASVSLNSTKDQYYAKEESYLSATSGLHGITLTSSGTHGGGEIKFHVAGLYVIHLNAEFSLQESTDVPHVQFTIQPQFDTGAGWSDYPARSAVPTYAGGFSNTMTDRVGAGTKMRMEISAADTDSTTPTNPAYCSGFWVQIWRAST